jgi:hypothetical protein
MAKRFFSWTTEVSKYQAFLGMVVHLVDEDKEDCVFEASLRCIERPCLKKRKTGNVA